MHAQMTGRNQPALIRDEAGNKLRIGGPGAICVCPGVENWRNQPDKDWDGAWRRAIARRRHESNGPEGILLDHQSQGTRFWSPDSTSCRYLDPGRIAAVDRGRAVREMRVPPGASGRFAPRWNVVMASPLVPVPRLVAEANRCESRQRRLNIVIHARLPLPLAHNDSICQLRFFLCAATLETCDECVVGMIIAAMSDTIARRTHKHA
jgi:hypothetical protein